jgi:hypothetical protein
MAKENTYKKKTLIKKENITKGNRIKQYSEPIATKQTRVSRA